MVKAVLSLKDMLAALDSIPAFTAGFDVAAFQEDDQTLSAVIRTCEMIGEAAQGLPEVIWEQYPEVPWKEMAGMRDRLIHFYFEVDVPRVWETFRRRLPELRWQVQPILEEQQREAP